MSAEMVWFLGSQIVLVINIVTVHTALRRKYSLLFSISMFVLVDLVLFSFLILTGETPGATRSITGFAFLPLVIWLFSGKLFQKIFAVFLVLQFTVGLTSLAGGFADLFIQSGSGEYTVIHFCIAIALLTVYCVLVFKFGRGILDKLFEYGRQAEWAFYSLGAAFSYAVMLFVNNRFGGIEQIIMLLFILWGFAVLCFTIINTHEKSKTIREAEFAANVISSGRDYYQKIDEMQDKLRIMRHDFKYHLTAISELTEAGDNKEIDRYLVDLQAQLSENEIQNYCSNSIINALLSRYAERCAKSGVKYDIVTSLPQTLTIPNYDLCIVLGNLLENALEACEKLAEGKYIELRLKPLENQLALMVRNCFDGELTTDGEKVVSTKKEGGLGLKSVEAVVARYDGELITEWDENTFTAYITIRL